MAFSLQTTTVDDDQTRIQLDWTISNTTIKWLRNIITLLLIMAVVSLGFANRASVIELLIALVASKP